MKYSSSSGLLHKQMYLFELSAEFGSQGGDEEHEAELVKLNTGGRRPANAGGKTLNEAPQKPETISGKKLIYISGRFKTVDAFWVNVVVKLIPLVVVCFGYKCFVFLYTSCTFATCSVKFNKTRKRKMNCHHPLQNKSILKEFFTANNQNLKPFSN